MLEGFQASRVADISHDLLIGSTDVRPTTARSNLPPRQTPELYRQLQLLPLVPGVGLNDLRKTGLYGNKVSGVIAHLVTVGIERLIREGIIEPRRHQPADSDLVEDDQDSV